MFFYRLSSFLFAVFTSLIITSFGFLFFKQRYEEAPSMLNTFTYDAQMYLNMANEIEVPGPYSCRILLPFLSKILPLQPLQSILIINIISFAALFYGLIKMLEKFFINRKTIIFSLGIISSTYSVAYNFTNPFLTDLPALVGIIFYINSIIKFRFISSLFWFSVSLLFRETAIVLIPLFLITFSLKKNIFACIFILLIYILPKLIISGNINCGFISTISLKVLLDLEFLIKTFLSYGTLWILGLIGFFSIKNYNKHLFKVACALLIFSLLGSILSSLKSVTDVTRMYFLSLPMLILGLALFIDKIFPKKFSYIYLVFLILAGFLLSIGYFPNIFINGNFNSLKEFARSNLIIIIFSTLIQFFAITMLVKQYLTNYYSSKKNSFNK